MKKIIMLLFFFLCLPLSQVEAMSWGFKRSENHIPPSAGKQLDELLAKYDAFYLGDPTKKYIYLTFDNGYENGYTAQILDILKQKKFLRRFL